MAHPNSKPKASLSLRSVADAVSKVSARVPNDNSDEFNASDAKAALNEAVGVLMELANRFPNSTISSSVEVSILTEGFRQPDRHQRGG